MPTTTDLQGSRQDQYSVTVEVDGDPTGVWDKMTGGGTEADSTKYKPGGRGSTLSLGGSSDISDIEVTRIYDLDRDHNGLVKKLLNRTGKAKVIVTKQPLDGDDKPKGDPLVYKGTLIGCDPPEHDSEGTEASMLAITVEVAGTVG